MFNGIFPCFEGFNQFAIWPAPQYVSILLYLCAKKNNESINVAQDYTYYTLISKEIIHNPQLLRSSITLPFHKGYQYVAFPALCNDEVIIQMILTLK